MVNKSKAKGTAAESATVSFLQANGFPYAERLALQGGKDRGDITGIPGICIEVKNESEYTFASWMNECVVETENSKADFGMVVAKPRLVGTTRTGQWYAIMYANPFWDLWREAKLSPGSADIELWSEDMSGANINRNLSRYLNLAEDHRRQAQRSHSCVRIAPNGVKDPNMYYVVTTLEQMSDLLVRAGYGRRDDPPGA